MMKSAFGSKRKARKIQVDEEEEPGTKGLQPASVDSGMYPQALYLCCADREP